MFNNWFMLLRPPPSNVHLSFNLLKQEFIRPSTTIQPMLFGLVSDYLLPKKIKKNKIKFRILD